VLKVLMSFGRLLYMAAWCSNWKRSSKENNQV